MNIHTGKHGLRPGSAARRLIASWLSTDPSPVLRDYVRSHRARYAALLECLDGLPRPDPIRSLEIGCGDGAFGALLAERYGWTLTGLDYNPELVRIAQRRGHDARMCDVDTQPLPFGAATFGLVMFDAVLEHLYRPHLVLGELSRVIAPGGFLVLGTINATDLGNRLWGVVGRNPFALFNRFNAMEGQARMRECAVFYTPAEIASFLDDHFEVVDTVWTNIYAHDQSRRSGVRNLATPLRLAICRAAPSLSGYFYLVLRRRTSSQ